MQPIPPPPHTHIHYRKQRDEIKHFRMQGKRTKVKIFPSEERKQKQESLLTSKIRKQKKTIKKQPTWGGIGLGSFQRSSRKSHGLSSISVQVHLL